ncbi:Uncharacterised protein [Vibrio cholerae]|nr:Uncharacterised protein [Vibrio cholerae]
MAKRSFRCSDDHLRLCHRLKCTNYRSDAGFHWFDVLCLYDHSGLELLRRTLHGVLIRNQSGIAL